jgi:hypothetical protein
MKRDPDDTTPQNANSFSVIGRIAGISQDHRYIISVASVSAVPAIVPITSQHEILRPISSANLLSHTLSCQQLIDSDLFIYHNVENPYRLVVGNEQIFVGDRIWIEADNGTVFIMQVWSIDVTDDPIPQISGDVFIQSESGFVFHSYMQIPASQILCRFYRGEQSELKARQDPRMVTKKPHPMITHPVHYDVNMHVHDRIPALVEETRLMIEEYEKDLANVPNLLIESKPAPPKTNKKRKVALSDSEDPPPPRSRVRIRRKLSELDQLLVNQRMFLDFRDLVDVASPTCSHNASSTGDLDSSHLSTTTTTDDDISDDDYKD